MQMTLAAKEEKVRLAKVVEQQESEKYKRFQEEKDKQSEQVKAKRAEIEAMRD